MKEQIHGENVTLYQGQIQLIRLESEPTYRSRAPSP